VFYHPSLRVQPGDFQMAARRPSLRFKRRAWVPPGPFGEELFGKVLHVWVPVRDER